MNPVSEMCLEREISYRYWKVCPFRGIVLLYAMDATLAEKHAPDVASENPTLVARWSFYACNDGEEVESIRSIRASTERRKESHYV